MGRNCGEQTVRTAGKPAKLQLSAWTQHDECRLNADGTDMAFVTVSLTDADGTLIPDAADQLTFEVTGAGSFKAACNGDATSLEPFTEPTMRLFSGQLVVVAQAARQQGNLVLTVSDAQRGLSETITIPVK
jgi:beta-galactosidase